MRDSKQRLEPLALTLIAAVSMMLLTAVSAQAQTHTEKLHAAALHNAAGGPLNPEPLASPATNSAGTFLVNLGFALLATATGSQIGEGFLLVPARDLEIKCTSVHVQEGEVISSTVGLAKVEFLGCLSFSLSSLEHLSACVLKSLGSIIATVLILPILHGPVNSQENFLLFEPEIGQHITTISYKPGMGCILPLNNPVLGSVVALVHALDAVRQLILFSPGIQLLTGDVLTFGGNTAYIDGHGEAELTGLHANQKLGVH